MSQEIILNADTRERTGTNKARVIRNIDGMVPAIIYGNEKDSLNIKLRLNELTKASQNELFYTQVLVIKTENGDEKVVLKELQRDPAKGKFLHADFLSVSSKTKLKVMIPFIFLNEDECEGVKLEGGVITKAIREIEILCSAGNIPESIEVDVTSLMIGDAIRLTDLNLPDGSEIPGLTEETDQLVVSVNAPRAEVEEEPEIEEGDALEADGDSASDDSADEGSSEEQENSEETSE